MRLRFGQGYEVERLHCLSHILISDTYKSSIVLGPNYFSSKFLHARLLCLGVVLATQTTSPSGASSISAILWSHFLCTAPPSLHNLCLVMSPPEPYFGLTSTHWGIREGELCYCIRRSCFVRPHPILCQWHQTHAYSVLGYQFCSFSFISTPSMYPLS